MSETVTPNKTAESSSRLIEVRQFIDGQHELQDLVHSLAATSEANKFRSLEAERIPPVVRYQPDYEATPDGELRRANPVYGRFQRWLARASNLTGGAKR